MRALALAVVLATLASVAALAATGGPNLRVTRMAGAPGTAVRGAAFDVHYTVRNVGRRLAGRSGVGFYFRRGAASILIGKHPAPALFGRSERSGTAHLQLPRRLAAGSWRIVACADRRDSVRETDEGDNCRAARRATTIPPPPPPPAPVTLGSPPDGALLAAPRPVLSGTADPRLPVTVDLTAGGAPAATLSTQPTASGAWAVAPSQALADGSYTARARQGSGTRLRTSLAHSFTIDTTAPAVSVDHPGDGATTDLMALDGDAGTAPRDGASVAVSVYAGAPAGAPLQTFDAAVDGGRWSVLAAVLAPGTYSVMAEQSDAAGNRRRASATFTVPVSLLAAGDIAGCDSDGDSATAALLPLHAGTIAPLGDNVYDSPGVDPYPDCYGPTWGPFLGRTMPVPGNHEYEDSPGAADYFAYFGAAAHAESKGYYSYDLGAWHVIVLNSSDNCFAVPCETGDPQESWLRADLAAHAGAKCTLAYFHHPRFSSYIGRNTRVGRLWRDLYDGGADLVLNGHAHNYERYAAQDPFGSLDAAAGIVEIVAGTGGRSHHAFGSSVDQNSVVHDDDTFGVLDLTLAAGGWSWRFLPAAGGSFTDAGSADCH